METGIKAQPVSVTYEIKRTFELSKWKIHGGFSVKVYVNMVKDYNLL